MAKTKAAKPKPGPKADPGTIGCGIDVPRLPTAPARWVLDDPRSRAYFVFWQHDRGTAHEIAYAARMERADPSTETVRLTIIGCADVLIQTVRVPMPRGNGTAVLYRCPSCRRPTRYLYFLGLSGGRLCKLRDCRCQQCARLRWASQGEYQRGGRLGRGALGRYPVWDPRAVSDPSLLKDEFPELWPSR
jgi:hypothetical protein